MNPPRLFIFDSYAFYPETGRIELNYAFDNGMTFQEVVMLPKQGEWAASPESPRLQAALFSLHIAGGISYYKAFCPPEIQVKSGTLTQDEAAFWNTVYEKGLGQFFYENNLDFRGLIRFPSGPEAPVQQEEAIATPSRLLVPFGGGKDSVVTVELLREAGISFDLVRVGPHPLIDRLAQTAGKPLLQITRQLDPALFKLNAEGAYNGHVPITTYLSFLLAVEALLGGYDGIAFSNERSANYGNVEYLGLEVNHQWSKSWEAEQLIRARIVPGVCYLNYLRPLSDLAIAKQFVRYPQYFHEATSCNVNWRLLEQGSVENRWCGKCPKCAFTFLLFAAFLPIGQVVDIFGGNLFEREDLLPLYKELAGVEGFKPFECVGTPEESIAAFYLATKDAEAAQTAVGSWFAKEVLPGVSNPEAAVRDALSPEYVQGLPADVKAFISKQYAL